MVVATVERPAIAGGTPVRTAPLASIGDSSGRDVGDEELAQLTEVIRSGALNRNNGTKVQALEEAWAERHGVRFATAATSGTAAIHVALGALHLEPGDEVITTPITDWGTVGPILAQNCVPVFADIDPRTYCLDPEQAAAAITPRTRAIIAVHLMGQPCDMDAFRALARQHNLYLIEDCAQAHFATWRGQVVGSIGDIGCFSLQQSKVITTGDGGMTTTDDPELGMGLAFFQDKGWSRGRVIQGMRVYKRFGLNYRMTELQGAVALAQLAKGDRLAEHRRKIAAHITAGIADVPGVHPPYVAPQAVSSYWHYMPTIDPEVLGVGGAEFAKALSAEGIGTGAGYAAALYLQDMFQRKQVFGTSHFPFDYGDRNLDDVDYSPGLCPVSEKLADSTRSNSMRLPCHEGITEADADDMVTAIAKVGHYFAER